MKEVNLFKLVILEVARVYKEKSQNGNNQKQLYSQRKKEETKPDYYNTRED